MKNKLKSIMFNYYYTGKSNKLLQVIIPIESVEILEIHKITSSFLYLGNGKYDYIDRCGSLELRLSLDKLSRKDVDILSSKICLVSIKLEFINSKIHNLFLSSNKLGLKNIKWYNLPYYSSNSISNDLQKIEIKNNKVYIDMNEGGLYVRK